MQLKCANAVQEVVWTGGVDTHHYLHGKVVEKASPARHPPYPGYQPSYQGAKDASADHLSRQMQDLSLSTERGLCKVGGLT